MPEFPTNHPRRPGRPAPVVALATAAILVAVLPILGASLGSGRAQAGEFTRTLTMESQKLELINMIGEVTVERGTGDSYAIEIHVRGDDADEELVEIIEKNGRDGRVMIKFPIEEHRDYVYPGLGRHSKTTFTFKDHRGGSWIDDVLGSIGGKKITVRGSGRGLELWADVTVKVPDGHKTEVLHKVGAIKATGVQGDLLLDTASGSVAIEQCEGKIVADTGSGMVEALGIRGDLRADTGSGSVLIEDFEGDEMVADTGSGRVETSDVRCSALNIDTGSGGVEAERVSAERGKIDTGSGRIRLQLDEIGEGRFVLDTGSGSVDLVLPRRPSVEVSAETGSGSIRVDVDDADYHYRERDEVEFVVGGGKTRIVIDTGSGSIRIRER
jgi:hypothetical protein